jgi:hypothetical protein
MLCNLQWSNCPGLQNFLGLVWWKHYRQLEKDQEYNIGKITYLQRVGFAHRVTTSFLPLEYLQVLRSYGHVVQVRMQ